MSTITKALVNSAHGIYAAEVLSQTHELLFLNNRIVDESVKIGIEYYTPLKNCIEESFDGFEDETLDSIFNPTNDFFNENVDLIQSGLCRVNLNGEYWMVDTFDGEFYAVHPDAVWDHDKNEYII